MAALKMFLCSPILIVVIASLQQTQVVSAYHNPYQELLWVRYDRQSSQIEQVDERYIEYAEDSEEDESFSLRKKRDVVEAEEEGEEEEVVERDGEDDSLTEEDIEDLALAREELDDIQRQILARATLNATINGTTIVNLNNTYFFQSHDLFGIVPYPNLFWRWWYFLLGAHVFGLELYCPFFRVEWAKCCQNDKFITFLRPYSVGRRHCGQIHGLYKVYYRDLKIVWKTNWIVRKAGFCCRVKPIPCCGAIPPTPVVKTVVRSCADLRPQYPQCNCTDLAPGIICLRCSICETCDTEFFVVHDFSQVYIYIYLEYPCPYCPLNLRAVILGFELRVLGHVECLNAYAPHVIKPIFPNSVFILAVFCPINQAFFDVCQYFRSFLPTASPPGKNIPVIVDGNLPRESRATPGSLVILVNQGNAPGTPSPPVNLSTLSHPEKVISLTINDSQCDFFSQGQHLNLTLFTQVEEIDIYLCNVTLPCGSIIINSTNIEQVTIHLPDPLNCDPDCVVGNQASPGVPPPGVNCQASN